MRSVNSEDITILLVDDEKKFLDSISEKIRLKGFEPLSVSSGEEAVARDGEVFVSVNGSILQEKIITDKAMKIMAKIDGVKAVRIGVTPSIYVPF